jgi:hypothetical protein
MLDYMTAGTLLALPALLKPSSEVATLLRGAGVGTLVYSLLTDYELGAAGVIPMQGHLLLDAMSGATFAAAPLLFPDEDKTVLGVMVGLGVFELMASLMTETQPTMTPESRHALSH